MNSECRINDMRKLCYFSEEVTESVAKTIILKYFNLVMIDLYNYFLKVLEMVHVYSPV